MSLIDRRRNEKKKKKEVFLLKLKSVCTSILSLPSTQIHELGNNDCPKSYVFRGSKEYASKLIHDMLGLGPTPLAPGQRNLPPNMGGRQGSLGALKFLQPLNQCEFAITSVIENLRRDPWPVATGKRPTRCTGVAISVAISLLE
ncbi:GTPase-activating protein S23, partial [Coelomomyces lativittatus]